MGRLIPREGAKGKGASFFPRYAGLWEVLMSVPGSNREEDHHAPPQHGRRFSRGGEQRGAPVAGALCPALAASARGGGSLSRAGTPSPHISRTLKGSAELRQW